MSKEVKKYLRKYNKESKEVK